MLPEILKTGVVHEAGQFLFNLVGEKREDSSKREQAPLRKPMPTAPRDSYCVNPTGYLALPCVCRDWKEICVLM